MYVEEGGEVREEEGKVAGYVVDHQPDLRVARVLPWLLLGRWAGQHIRPITFL